VEVQREREQVGVTGAGADFGGPSGRGLRGLVVTCRGSRDRQPACAPRTGLERVNRMAILRGSFFLTIK
jgi:hypothetical protein